MLLGLVPLLGCSEPAVATAVAEVTMDGSFTWTLGGNDTTAIAATLTPSGEDDTWNATFTFRFNGSRHKWRGELRGNLAAGPFSGTVSSGRGRNTRTWQIVGEVHNGVLVATHAEQSKRGDLEHSGELRLEVRD